MEYINSQSPFVQSLIASALFMIAVFILRWLLRLLKYGGKSSIRIYSRMAIVKHRVYKEFVSSSRMENYTWGYLFVICQVLQFLVLSAMVLIFVFGVQAFIKSEWFTFIGYFIAFNYIFEANSWLQDWSSEKELTLVDDDIKKEMLPNKTEPAEEIESNEPKG